MRTPIGTWLLICASIAGCVATGPEATGRFVTNGQTAVLSHASMQELTTHWTNDAEAVFGGKWVGSRDAPWILDFIARAEARGPTPCRDLKAMELARLGLKPFTYQRAYDGVMKTISPREYNEAWIIDACGVKHEWRVVDDPSDSANPLRVLLWHVG